MKALLKQIFIYLFAAIFLWGCKKEREAHPIGTKFYTENVKVCKKPDGRFYLRAKDQMIYKI